jgi:hypothetical protein
MISDIYLNNNLIKGRVNKRHDQNEDLDLSGNIIELISFPSHLKFHLSFFFEVKGVGDNDDSVGGKAPNTTGFK